MHDSRRSLKHLQCEVLGTVSRRFSGRCNAHESRVCERGPVLAVAWVVTLFIGIVLCLSIGISLGLLGGGGSILTVPVLHYVFGMEAHQAVATSLVVVGVTSSIAVVAHARKGFVEWRAGAVFGIASMASAFVGAVIGARLPGVVLMVAFALVMIAAGVSMLVRARSAASPPLRAAHVGRMVAVGFGVGLLTGILGAGGGFIIVPALALVGGLPMRKAVGTSLFVIALNALSGLAGVVAHAHLDLRVSTAVSVLAIAGSFVGVRMSRRLSVTALQRAFAWLVIVVAVVILINFAI
jgi:uncharacterized membrane protein YfcA